MHASDSPDVPALRALLFGATGPIGRRVLERLLAHGWAVTALSRDAQPARDGVDWRRGGFPDTVGEGDGFDAILSCGPLDLFSRWYADTPTGLARVVAFGSTSVHVKADSPDAAERDLAERLREGEARVAQVAAERGAIATLLRPTLVYGGGGDRSLSRIVALARRHGFFPLPHDALGLRQPVHVDDLADAALAALARPGSGVRAYDLPGGETLSYREMVERTLASLDPPARPWLLPAPLFALAASGARLLGMHDAGPAVLARMREDLAFDDIPARRELGYVPRGFEPEAWMFGAGEAD